MSNYSIKGKPILDVGNFSLSYSIWRQDNKIRGIGIFFTPIAARAWAHKILKKNYGITWDDAFIHVKGAQHVDFIQRIVYGLGGAP